MKLDPAEARSLMERVAIASTRNDAGEASVAVLNFLLKQLRTLRDLANGYPRNSIEATVWFDGRALAEVCDELTSLLEGRDLLEQQELASRLAAGIACQVMSHYPEQIFPRVLRNARLQEKIGNVQEAIGSYESIVGDFEGLELPELLSEEPLESASRTIFQAAYEAATRLRELCPDRQEALTDLLTALETKLSREALAD